MLRKILLKVLCIFILLQTVLTHDHVGEFLEKLRSSEKKLAPQWMATYLQTLRNLHMPEHVTLSDLRSLERLLKYLNQDQSNELQKHIDVFLKEFIHSDFKFENERKRDGNSKITLNNENEGDSKTDEILQEDDLQKSETLHQIFTDLFLLKSKVKDITKEIPSIIENIAKNYGEMNEQQLQDMKVNLTGNSTENVGLLSEKLEWIREKAQNVTEMLFQSPVFGYVRILKEYLVQKNVTEVEELEEEIEYLLKELEESEEEDLEDLLRKFEESKGSFVAERNKMEEENLNEIENNYSGNLSQARKSKIPENFNVKNPKETNRKGRKLFEEIKTNDKERKPVLNNTKDKDRETIVWKKTFRILGEDKVRKDQPKETLDKDEKWKIEVYNKVFKDYNKDMKNEIVDEILQAENATKSQEITKKNIEKLFGNKNETKAGENEKWELKKALKIFLRENETITNENEKLAIGNKKQQQLYEKLFGINETVYQSQKLKETENSTLEDKSYKEKVYDQIISKAEIIGNKTNNVTNYIVNLTNYFQTGGNNESLLKKIFEDINGAKENVSNYIGNITNYFQTGGNNESQLWKIFEEIRYAKDNVTQIIRETLGNIGNNIFQSSSEISQDPKIKSEEDKNKWPLNYLNEKLLNTKENIINKEKRKSEAVKHLNHIKTDLSMEGSPMFLTKTKLISLSKPVGESPYKKSSTYTTVTSTFYRVLLTNTTKNIIYEKTVTFTRTEVLEIPLSTSLTKNPSVDKKATKKYL